MLVSIIPTHKVAQLLLVNIHKLLDFLGLEKEKGLEDAIYIGIIVVLALFLGWVARWLILYCAKKIMMIRDSSLTKELMDHHVLVRCSHVIPPLVMLALLPFAFTSDNTFKDIVFKVLLIYTSIVICMALCKIASFIWMRFDEKRNTKNLPLKGIMDTVVGILWVITIIICVSILVDKSPVTLLTGLGAFAAVLMLVFKDSILGLVAGMQLSQNDMLRVGDWIVVPSTIANGIVIDVSLTSVKVQNFDNTIVTLPPYSLISSSFQNWRGMTNSGCRQIARSVIFDSDTISTATPELIDKICNQFPIVKPYVDKLKSEGKMIYDPGIAVVNGSLETNLGLFRIYMCQWLINNPAITDEEQILVRVMTPTGEGIPLQLWCYTATTQWTAYEAIQSAIFEHLIAVAPSFGLRLFNDPSGTDVTNIQIKNMDTSSHPVNIQPSSPTTKTINTAPSSSQKPASESPQA
ncbi:MAG: mechanosensitive ion channel family protein [Duncaniella sp.]|nr:mechanosensitive ion channel family protein [Muribaculum sp.]MCM1254782.1 mechanosensitive ion channel family protein [Duncaniella sp.]